MSKVAHVNESEMKQEEAIAEKTTAEKPENEKKLPQQIHQFIPVTETTRTYIFPKGEKVRVDHVYGISIRPDGGHRLLTRGNTKHGMTIAPGWLTILHEVNAENINGYVFTE